MKHTITPLAALAALLAAQSNMQSVSDYLPGCRLRSLLRAQENARDVLATGGPVEIELIFDILEDEAAALGCTVTRDARANCFNFYNSPFGLYAVDGSRAAHAFCVSLREVAEQIANVRA